MRLLDSHAHVNFNAFKDDGDEVIRKSLEAGVGMILVGSESRTSNRAIDYANHYETGVWAAIGLHPSQLFATRVQGEDYDFMSRGEELDIKKYDKLADLYLSPASRKIYGLLLREMIFFSTPFTET